MEELIRPNWHIALVHFPIALLTLGILIEVFSCLGWRRSSFRWGGRWMLLLGAMLSVPATFSGLYAISTVTAEHGGWLGMDRNSDLYKSAWDHMWMLSTATLASMVMVTLWIACSNIWRDRLSLVFKLGLLCVLGLSTWGAHQGGDLVYGFKLGVHGEGASKLPKTIPTTQLSDHLDSALRSEQVHVVLAGFALSLACVCLGLSLRAVAQNENIKAIEDNESLENIASAFVVPGMSQHQQFQTPVQKNVIVTNSLNHTRPAKAGRFWFLAVLLIASTAFTGLWILSRSEGTTDLNKLIDTIRTPEPDGPQFTRRMVHTVAGVGILVDAVLLMFASVIARRSKFVVVILAAPMILFIAIQVWMGVLLILDGHEGKLTGFGPITSSATSQP